jgi:hypothetical protein
MQAAENITRTILSASSLIPLRRFTFVTDYDTQPNLAHLRDVTGDGRLMKQGRCPRAGFVTPLSGGSGIVPAGMTTGERGAPLKRE